MAVVEAAAAGAAPVSVAAEAEVVVDLTSAVAAAISEAGIFPAGPSARVQTLALAIFVATDRAARGSVIAATGISLAIITDTAAAVTITGVDGSSSGIPTILTAITTTATMATTANGCIAEPS
jgi:hypothetical protein